MLSICAKIFGIIMLLIGILGFIPEAAPNDYLFGLFHINSPHNLIHIITGAAALLCGIASEHASRLFFKIFGVIYALVAILGFFHGDRHILGVVANNMADNLLHVAIAALSLFLGFGCCCCCPKDQIDPNSTKLPPEDKRE